MNSEGGHSECSIHAMAEQAAIAVLTCANSCQITKCYTPATEVLRVIQACGYALVPKAGTTDPEASMQYRVEASRETKQAQAEQAIRIMEGR